MSLKRSLVLLLAVCLTVLMIACGNSSKPITVTVTPSISSTTVPAGSSAVTLNVTVANDSKNGGVTWGLVPSSGCGTLSGSGTSVTYTPPSAATLNSDCTATITATSAADSTKNGNVQLTIKAITVSVASSSGSTTTFGSGAPNVTLTATLNNEASGANDVVNWSMTGALLGASRIVRPQVAGINTACGTLVPNGTTATYTPPTSITAQCTATITAASTINSHQVNTTMLTVNPIGVTITAPVNPVTEFADKGAIALTSSITNDGANAGLNWTVNGCGTVSGNASGATYTPPAAPSAQCTAVVTATSTTDPTKSASAPTFTINPIVSVAVNGSGSLAEGATMNVSATVTNDLASPSGVTWAVTPSSCGSVTGSGLSVTYNTPMPLASACTATVTATSNADPTKSNHATIAVTPTSVSITSPSGAQNLAANKGNVILHADITNDGSAQGITWSLTPTTGCGTINIAAGGNDGIYTPPAEPTMNGPCTANLKAASTADSQHNATVAITENPVSLSAITGAPSQGVAQGSAAISLYTTPAYDATNSPVNFVLTAGASCGSLGPAHPSGASYYADFTPAASVTGNCVATVTAESAYDNTREQQVNITVLPLTVTITSPANNTGVTVGAQQAITASVSNDVGGGSVTWTLTPVAPALSCGALTGAATGLNNNYSAPPTPGCSAIVTATSVDDNTKSASVTLNVVAGITVTLNPAGPKTIDANNPLSITATVNADSAGKGVNLSLNPPTGCGALSATSANSGAAFSYNPPASLSNSCNVNVIATSISDNTRSATLSLTVYPSLTLPTPNPTSLGSATTGLAYTGNINASGGNGPYTWSVTGLSDGLSSNASTSTGNTLTITGTPSSATTVSFQVSVQDATGLTVGPVTYSITVNGYVMVSLPTTTLPTALMGQNYNGSINASGGVQNYTFTVNGTTIGSTATAIPNSDGLSGTSSGGNTLFLSGMPNSVGTYTLNVSVKDGENNTASQSYTLTVTNASPLSITTTQDKVPNGLVGFAYSLNIDATGGSGDSGNYQFTYTGLPSWLAPTPNPTSGQLAGTPSAAGSWQITVSVKDTTTNQTSSTVNLTVTVGGPDGAHNSYLYGRYSCLLNGFLDSDGSRVASLVTFVADGHGNISSGSFSGNGRTLGLTTGAFSGTYSVDTTNNALFRPTDGLIKSGVSSPIYLMALNKVSGTTADTVRLIEADDSGSSASGVQSSGVCYLTSTSAFVNPVSGNFVFAVGGEDPAGVVKGTVGRLSISGTSISATLDQQHGNQYQNQSGSGSFSSATPDTTGALTATLGTNSYKLYVIDSNRLLMMMYDATKPEAESGQLRKQQQSSYSMSQLTGSIVVYGNGQTLNVTGGAIEEYGSLLAQGTWSGSGSSGTLTFNTAVQNNVDPAGNNIAYMVNYSGTIGQAMPVTVGTNGRAVLTTDIAGGIYIYLYDTNSAVFLDASSDGVGVNVGLGWAEPQSGAKTDAAIADKYMFGNLPELNQMFNGSVGIVDVSSGGTISGTSNNAWQGGFDWMNPLPSGITYTWDGATGTFGLIDINQGGGNAMNCISITTGGTTNKFACIQQGNKPDVMVMQQ